MINLTAEEKSGLSAIDERKLYDLIDLAVTNESSIELHRLEIWRCGTHISTKLSHFDRSLKELREAKSAKKREQKLSEARRSGHNLFLALGDMKRRMEEEERDGRLFYVEDHVYHPPRFDKNLEVSVSYRWRSTAEDSWRHSSILFRHEHNPRHDFTLEVPKRKPSAAKQAQDLQDELTRTWEDFKRSAQCSVRDYFRSGGDGGAIPSSFRAIADSRTGGLNNLSTDFWKLIV